jgi:hypothetical protein
MDDPSHAGKFLSSLASGYLARFQRRDAVAHNMR